MKRKYTKADRDYLNRENLNYSEKLTVVTDVKLQNNTTNKILGVWRSRRFLVVLWQEENGNQRLSCQRTKMTVDGEWVDGITWDDLQRLKGEAGFGDRWAVEIFPPNYAVVNVANIRHLWLMTNPPGFGWHSPVLLLPAAPCIVRPVGRLAAALTLTGPPPNRRA